MEVPPPAVGYGHHRRVIVSGVHGGLQLLDPRPGRPRGQLSVQPFKVILPERIPAADDEGAVPADDIGVDKGVHSVEGQGIADVVRRQARHQGGADLPALHGICAGRGHKHDLFPGLVCADGHLALPLVQGPQEGLLVGDLQLAAVEGYVFPGFGVQAQVVEASGLGAVDQVVPQLIRGRAVGRVGLYQGFHLLQTQVDGGGKMERNALAHAVHVDFSHLADGFRAALVHVHRQKGKNAGGQNEQQNQADGKKLNGRGL